MSLLAL